MRVGECEEAIRPARVVDAVNSDGNREGLRIARGGREVGDKVVMVNEVEAVLFGCGKECDDKIRDADRVVDVQDFPRADF